MISCSECCLTCSFSEMGSDLVLRCKCPIVNSGRPIHSDNGSVMYKLVSPFAVCFNHDHELTTEPEREEIIKTFLERLDYAHVSIW